MSYLSYSSINNREKYNEYCKRMNHLMALQHKNKQQMEELDVITLLIEEWDAEKDTRKDIDPFENLRISMQSMRVSKNDLQKVIGVPENRLSEILVFINEFGK